MLCSTLRSLKKEEKQSLKRDIDPLNKFGRLLSVDIGGSTAVQNNIY